MPGAEWLLNLAGAAALLLWGVRMVRTGVMRAYGAELRRTLGRATRNRLNAAGIGLLVAGLLQSSTATALLAVAFSAKGLLATTPGLAMMLGADLGSTFVVQVLSFDLSWLSPGLVLVGVVAFFAGPEPQGRHIGRAAIGLGLTLLALHLLIAASASLRQSPALSNLIAALEQAPFIAVFLAALVTWLAHSSVAFVLLIMSLAASEVISPELGLVLVLGANLGAGMVPVALTWRSDAAARRLPLGNLAFRFCGVTAGFFLITPFAEVIASIDADPARQIANFHTVFNLLLVIVFLPFVGFAASLLETVLPQDASGDGRGGPRHLDETVIETPAIALSCATREVMRMADTVETMLEEIPPIFEERDSSRLINMEQMEEQVDALQESLKLYLTAVSRTELSDVESRRCMEILLFATNLEHIGDIVDNNLLELAKKKIKRGLAFSKPGWRDLSHLHASTLRQMQLAISVFVSGDAASARRLISAKEQFRNDELAAKERHLARLRKGQVDSIETSALHLDILRDLKRVVSHLTSVAYPILEATGELNQSRLKVGSKGPERATSAG